VPFPALKLGSVGSKLPAFRRPPPRAPQGVGKRRETLVGPCDGRREANQPTAGALFICAAAINAGVPGFRREGPTVTTASKKPQRDPLYPGNRLWRHAVCSFQSVECGKLADGRVHTQTKNAPPPRPSFAFNQPQHRLDGDQRIGSGSRVPAICALLSQHADWQRRPSSLCDKQDFPAVLGVKCGSDRREYVVKGTLACAFQGRHCRRCCATT